MPRITELNVGQPVQTVAQAAATILYAVQNGASRQIPVSYLSEYIQGQALALPTHVVTNSSVTADFNTLLVVTAVPVTITLPLIASSHLSKSLHIIHRAPAGTITITGFGGQQINGAASMMLTIPYSTATLIAIEPVPGTFEWVRL